MVLLHLPAQYGSEAILRHIYEMSGAKWRIHVDPGKFNDYLCSDDLGDCTDADPGMGLNFNTGKNVGKWFRSPFIECTSGNKCEDGYF